MKILRARAEQSVSAGEPGQVIAGDGGAGVVAGEGVLWLQEVQLAGKRPQPIDAFLRGAAGLVGSRLAGQ